ncbi:Protein of unknown function [Pyronema omphalodes CBS 100304]|uniref:Uncharacterized protein n=1 Tax=Pyronema omphalodes (strain CBS 100304) TaxID=1076935 RepID=U4L9X3_PYROM|nr:Protein of unknown function [Pyronema omphalodes CBS 100304]
MTGWILLQDTVCVVVISSIILLKLYILFVALLNLVLYIISFIYSLTVFIAFQRSIKRNQNNAGANIETYSTNGTVNTTASISGQNGELSGEIFAREAPDTELREVEA